MFGSSEPLRIETDRDVETVVRLVTESITSNRRLAGYRPALDGKVSTSGFVLRRFRPLGNSGYPVFRGSIRRENGVTVIEGICTTSSRVEWVYLTFLALFLMTTVGISIAQHDARPAVIGTVGVAVFLAYTRLSQRLTRQVLMADVELMVREIRQALSEIGG